MARQVDVQALFAINKRLGDAVTDPAIWPEFLGQSAERQVGLYSCKPT